MRVTRRDLFTSAGAAGALVAAERTAAACGGFFCAQTPIDQAGEQILFALSDKGVTAHISIQYTGRAEDFAWVVPVMSKPTNIAVGSQRLFTSLNNLTSPMFRLEWEGTQPSCGVLPGAVANSPTGGFAADAGASRPTVVVVDEREVGPYNTVVLESEDAQELVKWLKENKYEQPPSALPLIEHYVKEKMLFLALKLKQNAMTGDITPLVLEMSHPEACVPLILTRVAAVNDMPVLVYVLGKGRAVPHNWFHVEVNPRLINWLQGGFNYRQIATQAVNEAAGHGFITEYAGPSDIMRDQLYREGQYPTATWRTLKNPIDFVGALFRTVGRGDTLLMSLLRTHIPMPASLREQGVSEQVFYNDLATGGFQYGKSLAGTPFDPDAFVKDFEERYSGPLKAAQALFGTYPYLTRLFSTVSPDEMTRDPLFVFNTKMPPVPRERKAKVRGRCINGDYRDLEFTFDNGDKLNIPGPISWGSWPISTDTTEVYARTISLIGEEGLPVYYSRAQTPAVDQALDRGTPETVRSMRFPGPTPEQMGQGTRPTTATRNPDGTIKGSGCSVGGGASAGAALLIGAAGVLAALRTRGAREKS